LNVNDSSKYACKIKLINPLLNDKGKPDYSIRGIYEPEPEFLDLKN
jgi:hypothetical protein